MKFDHNDQNRRDQIERAVEEALRPFASATEAGIAAIALARVTRRLLEKYKRKDTRQQLTEVIVDFLEKRDTPRFMGIVQNLFGR